MLNKPQNLHTQDVLHTQRILKKNLGTVSLNNPSVSNTLRNGEYKKQAILLNLSSLNGILKINLEKKWILVEPRMTFAELCHFTLQYGLTPPVVPEFRSITVGGAIMGAALESSSHRFGQVSDTCLEYELILGNGELIHASAEENRDLFYGISGSYGTLAILTAVKLQLVETKKWVHLTYRRFSRLEEAVAKLTEPKQCDFIEGIALNRENILLIEGNMSAESSASQWNPKHFWSQWYIQHAAKAQKKEVMPIDQYLFRLDRAAFWMGSYVHSFNTMLRLLFHLGTPKIKKNSLDPRFLFRFLFGWALSSQRLYRIWHKVPNSISENLFFIHDYYTPFSHSHETLNNFMDETEIFPIWLCPIKGTQTPQFLSPHFGEENYLNIGLYGIPKTHSSIPELTAKLEKEIIRYKGRKMLYSFCYYDEETFSKIYDEPRYTALRKKYYAEKTFPTLYNKVINNTII